MGDVNSTIVVNFSDEAAAGAIVSVELDDQLNLDPSGEIKSQFYPGDQVYFLVHHDDTVKIESVLTTSGSVNYLGKVGRQRTQQMFFKSTDEELSVSHIVSSLSAAWYGRESSLTADSNKIKAASIPCIGDVTHGFSAHSYVLTPPSFELVDDEKYYIGVVVNIGSVL